MKIVTTWLTFEKPIRILLDRDQSLYWFWRVIRKDGCVQYFKTKIADKCKCVDVEGVVVFEGLIKNVRAIRLEYSSMFGCTAILLTKKSSHKWERMYFPGNIIYK